VPIDDRLFEVDAFEDGVSPHAVTLAPAYVSSRDEPIEFHGPRHGGGDDLIRNGGLERGPFRRESSMVVKELGHVVLYVRDVSRSRKFYRDVLRWTDITPAGDLPIAAFSSGRTHHELLLIEVGSKATPIPEGRRVGLYHFGLKVGESDDELREVVAVLRANRVPILGATDHGVTHSVYIEDPDGNEIELYIDVQPEVWRDHPERMFAPSTPLKL